MAFGDPDAPGQGGSRSNGGDAREAAIAAGGKSRTGTGSRTGGETARERGIRQAATAPDRTRARSQEGRTRSPTRAFTADFASRMRDAQRGTNPFSFIGKLFTGMGKRAKEALDFEVDETKVTKGLLGLGKVAGVPMSPMAMALSAITNEINEAMVAAGHKPGTVAGQTFAEDDWGGFRDATEAHTAERGGPGTTDKPARPPVTDTPPEREPDAPAAMSEDDQYWWDTYKVHFPQPQMGTGAGLGMTQSARQATRMTAQRERAVPGSTESARRTEAAAPTPALAYIARVNQDIRAARGRRPAMGPI